jgi:signal transduction histidine kinase
MEPAPASQTILSETARLSDMVEDLLSISRIDSITAEQKTVMCDLPEILTTAAEEQRHMAEEHSLTFVCAIEETPLIIPGNDKTLHRGFSNLISNAIRYARHQIVLSCRRQDHHIVVSVADDGPGIDADDRPHIFERFYKGRNGNHGIGLAIVKSVVEQHGGTIDVRSDSSGTSFRLTFPLPDASPTQSGDGEKPGRLLSGCQ